MLNSFLSESAEPTTLKILNLFISQYYFHKVSGLKIRDAVDWPRAVSIFRDHMIFLEK